MAARVPSPTSLTGAPPRPFSRPRSRRGFTLIELLLTTALLVLVISFVVVNVEDYVPACRLEGAARELGATVAEAQAQAVIFGKTHGIVYDLTGGRYWLLVPPAIEEGAAEDAAEAEGEAPRLVPLKPRRLHQGVAFKDISLGAKRLKMDGRVTVLFDPNGPAAPHAIHLIDGREAEMTVEVNPFAGTVEFFEGYHPFDIFLDEEDLKIR